nr:MAG TPA: hypothetical protein [Caudoviricetes sp.]
MLHLMHRLYLEDLVCCQLYLRNQQGHGYPNPKV